jgi:hypothetical protein
MKPTKKTNTKNEDFELNDNSFLPKEEYLHKYNNNIICVTDSKGYPQPNNKDLFEIRLDSSNGFIPLWEKGVTLNWRFSKSFRSYFSKPEAATAGVRKLLGEAIVAWQDACPIKFHEDNDAWDFEIAMHQKNCNDNGCVLASAFFPDPGQNIFYIYPTMFEQDHQEQIETIEHEIGHIFGLRHFFANISEREWSSELFGTDSAFSIMNYGDKSSLTADDIKDLKILYELVWSGKLTEINGTEIKLFKSYHMSTRSSNSSSQLSNAVNSKGLRELLLESNSISPAFELSDDVSLQVKRAILNVKGNNSTDPSTLLDGLELAANLLYSGNDFIVLAIKLNKLISDNSKKITVAEMRKCKTVGDCVTLVNCKL